MAMVCECVMCQGVNNDVVSKLIDLVSVLHYSSPFVIEHDDRIEVVIEGSRSIAQRIQNELFKRFRIFIPYVTENDEKIVKFIIYKKLKIVKKMW